MRVKVPTVHELASKMKTSDNEARGLIPPWEPEEEDEEDPLEWLRPLAEDGGFENMGPYTDPEIAQKYHSNDVELRIKQKTGVQRLGCCIPTKGYALRLSQSWVCLWARLLASMSSCRFRSCAGIEQNVLDQCMAWRKAS